MASEHGDGAVAGVDHLILEQPAEGGGEQHGDGQPHPNHRPHAQRVLHDDRVDHYLGEQRRGESQHLHDEGDGGHFAPDVLVELGHEPREAEGLGRGTAVGIVGGFRVRLTSRTSDSNGS